MQLPPKNKLVKTDLPINLALILRISNFKNPHWAGLCTLSAGNALLGNLSNWVFNHDAKRAGFSAFTAVGTHLKVNNQDSKLVAADCSLRTGLCAPATLNTGDRTSYHAGYSTLVTNSLLFSDFKEGEGSLFMLEENL